jgi:hypothetical protein
MLVNYPEAAHWPFDPTRLDLVEEFRRRPRGPHGDELQKLLHRMRWAGDFETGGRYVLVIETPGRTWLLARLPRRRGEPIQVMRNHVFTSIAEAEWGVFKLRWEALGGAPIPEHLREFLV